MKARVVEVNNAIFVLEILSVSGLHLPFKKIIYEHEELKKSKVVYCNSKSNTNRKKPLSTTFKIDSNAASLSSSTKKVKTKSTTYTFTESIEVTPRIKKPDVRIYRNMEGYRNSRNSEVRRLKFSSVSGYDFLERKLPPLELEALQVDDPSSTEGVNDFLIILEYIIKKIMPQFDVNYEIMNLPQKGKKICRLPNGALRKCVVASIRFNQNVVYIIEVDRSYLNSLATLILIPAKGVSPDSIRPFIDNVLESLVENNGWDYELLDQNNKAHYNRLWHRNDHTLEKWAERILNSTGLCVIRS